MGDEQLLLSLDTCDVVRNGTVLFEAVELKIVSRGAASALRAGAIVYPLLQHNKIYALSLGSDMAEILLPMPGGEADGDLGYTIRVYGDTSALFDVLAEVTSVLKGPPPRTSAAAAAAPPPGMMPVISMAAATAPQPSAPAASSAGPAVPPPASSAYPAAAEPSTAASPYPSSTAVCVFIFFDCFL
jgi:hypothetical protein